MNPHEALAQERKASAIARALHAAGFTADDAERFTPDQQVTAALAARQRAASAVTWAIVVARLRETPERVGAAS